MIFIMAVVTTAKKRAIFRFDIIRFNLKSISSIRGPIITTIKKRYKESILGSPRSGKSLIIFKIAIKNEVRKINK
jgi:hypothetical protein